MDDILIIDGYNIINSWTDLKELARDELESARLELLNIMKDYQGYKGIRIIIVYDAHIARGAIEKTEEYGGVQVIFTKENETADHYIERYVDNAPKYQRIAVATSDALLQTIIMSRGAIRISSMELLEQVNAVRRLIKAKYLNKDRQKSYTLEDFTSPEIIEILERWRRER